MKKEGRFECLSKDKDIVRRGARAWQYRIHTGEGRIMFICAEQDGERARHACGQARQGGGGSWVRDGTGRGQKCIGGRGGD